MKTHGFRPSLSQSHPGLQTGVARHGFGNSYLSKYTVPTTDHRTAGLVGMNLLA